TGPSKTDFCGVDRRHSGSHTSGTRCGRDERSVARKRFGRHSSPIVPQMRGPTIPYITAVFTSNRFRAEYQLFYAWRRSYRTSQSTLPDTSGIVSVRTRSGKAAAVDVHWRRPAWRKRSHAISRAQRALTAGGRARGSGTVLLHGH